MYLHELTKLHGGQEIPREVETNRLDKAAAREARANASRTSPLAWELKIERSAGRFLKPEILPDLKTEV